MADIVSRPLTEEGQDTWDRVFGKKVCQCKIKHGGPPMTLRECMEAEEKIEKFLTEDK